MSRAMHNRKLDCTEEEAKRFIGKRILVGLTHMDSENKVKFEEEFHGTIERINSKEGIVVKLIGSNEERFLPPEVSRLEMMRPGKYEICSTGETVVDPDFSGIWTIYSNK
jgi:hypothetical protein